MNLRHRSRWLTLVDAGAHEGERSSDLRSRSKSTEFALQAEGEGFEPSVPRKGHNGFETAPSKPLRHLSFVVLMRVLTWGLTRRVFGLVGGNASAARRGRNPSASWASWIKRAPQGRQVRKSRCRTRTQSCSRFRPGKVSARGGSCPVASSAAVSASKLTRADALSFSTGAT